MADITGYERSETNPLTGSAIPKKYHDNGDGTYSEQVYSGGGAALPAGTNNIGDVDVASTPKSATANVPAIGTTEVSVLTANANRKLWSIQNVGTNPLFVRLGASASSSVFHFILKGGTGDSDGLGAVLTDDMWTGVVSVAGTSPKYVVAELT